MKILFFILFFLNVTHAKEAVFDYANYEEALNRLNNIQFEMESTKVGLITTSFVGVAKQFILNYEIKDLEIVNGVVLIPIMKLDTNIDARNEKMFDLCFDSKKNKNIRIIIPSIKPGVQLTNASLELGGRAYPLQINTNTKIVDNKIGLSFDLVLSLKELSIPDPSIFIAKVNDKVRLSGSFSIER